MPHAPRRPTLITEALAAAVLVAAVLAALLTSPALAQPAPARPLPTKATWSADVRRVLAGAPDDLAARVASDDGARLAINLDIDNTSLATAYARGRAVRPTLALARRAHELGVAVLFNTGRTATVARGIAARLAQVGYPVDGLCTRETGETLEVSKQRCRASFVTAGYTIVANIGNNPTDFVGGDYERAYRLPNYRGRLS